MSDNYAMVRKQTFREWLRSKVMRQTHDDLKPTPEKFKSVVVLYNGVHLDWKDRLRVLIGGIPEFRTSIAFTIPQLLADEHDAFQTSFIVR